MAGYRVGIADDAPPGVSTLTVLGPRALASRGNVLSVANDNCPTPGQMDSLMQNHSTPLDRDAEKSGTSLRAWTFHTTALGEGGPPTFVEIEVLAGRLGLECKERRDVDFYAQLTGRVRLRWEAAKKSGVKLRIRVQLSAPGFSPEKHEVEVSRALWDVIYAPMARELVLLSLLEDEIASLSEGAA